MATLSPAEWQQAYRSALAIIGSNPDRSAVGIGFDLARIYGDQFGDINASTWRSVASRALASRDQADAMNDNPAFAPRRGELPAIDFVPPSGERFLYRVLVRVSDGHGNSADAVYDYYSDSPMSLATIAGDLQTRYADAFGYRTSKRQELESLGPTNPPEFVILSAGRR